MKKKLKPIELFLSLGLATTLAACGSPSDSATNEADKAVSETAPTSEAAHSGAAAEGGEGGEGGVSGDPDVDYMTSLALMKGHLMTAQELIDAGDYKGAEPHIGHPVEELYGGIEGQLAERNVTEFKGDLNKLSDLTKSAPDSPEMDAQFVKAIAGIDGAIAAIPESQLKSPDFVLAVISRSLDTAAEEYTAAISGEKFVEVIEYQDSRGFVRFSDELYKSISAEMSQSDPEAHATITENLAKLQEAWPAVQPPATPVMTPEEVSGLVSAMNLGK